MAHRALSLPFQGNSPACGIKIRVYLPCYVLENPVRAGLVNTAEEYLHSGTAVLGYPDLNPHEPGFWETFWKIDERLRKAGEGGLPLQIA